MLTPSLVLRACRRGREQPVSDAAEGYLNLKTDTEGMCAMKKLPAYFVFMQNPVGPVVRFAFHLGYRYNGFQVFLTVEKFSFTSYLRRYELRVAYHRQEGQYLFKCDLKVFT